MNSTPTEPAWDPKQAPSRFADTTANIHRTLAWMQDASREPREHP